MFEKKGAQVNFVCDTELLKTIDEMAEKRGIRRSEMLRILLTNSVSKEIAKENMSAIESSLRSVMADELRPYMERIVAINMKASLLSAADYFLLADMFQEIVPEERLAKTMLDESRRIAVEYIRRPRITDAETLISTTEELTNKLHNKTVKK